MAQQKREPQLFKTHSGKGSWAVRSHIDPLTAQPYSDGKPHLTTIGRADEAEELVRPRYYEFLSQINSQPKNAEFEPSRDTTFRDFVKKVYFPEAEKRLRGSSIRGYLGIWRGLEASPTKLGDLPLREIKTFHLQKAIEELAVRRNLAHASLARVRAFLKEVFAAAIRLGLRDSDTNPVGVIKIPVAKKAKPTYAYSLDEIEKVLALVPIFPQTVLAVAAWTGLRRGEIFGLQWQDLDEREGILYVRREISYDSKGRMLTSLPKTEASQAPIPLIGTVRKALLAWKTGQVGAEGQNWIFPAQFVRGGEYTKQLLDGRKLTPANPSNLLRDQILPVLKLAKIEWHGYHGFRRGLATNLRALGVDDLTISEILRHSDVAVTRKAYIKRVSKKSEVALDKLETELLERAIRQQQAAAYSN